MDSRRSGSRLVIALAVGVQEKDGLEDHVECRWSQAKSCFYTPKKAATAMESRRFRKQKFG
jgi:hypothetical protein